MRTVCAALERWLSRGWLRIRNVAQGERTYADVGQRNHDNSPRDQHLTNLIKVGRKQSALARDRQG